mmetsp:Transcript_72077/g.187614  ORF Transcript_72077/g.187614 Transcript_72077/m.187614 type:complete len:241 (-) Transcript_72077:634-1356(-)
MRPWVAADAAGLQRLPGSVCRHAVEAGQEAHAFIVAAGGTHGSIGARRGRRHGDRQGGRAGRVEAGRAPAAEEGEVAVAEVEAHRALEASPRRSRRQQVDVRALDGPRVLADLALSQHRASLWTKRHAASTATLEVHDREAQVVRVPPDLHLDIEALARLLRQEVRADAAAAIRDLVGVLHGVDLVAAKRSAERRHLLVKELTPLLPADPTESSQTAGRWRRGRCLRIWRLEWQESTTSI